MPASAMRELCDAESRWKAPRDEVGQRWLRSRSRPEDWYEGDRPSNEQPLRRLSEVSAIPSHLQEAIERSRYLCDLPPDWDDEGALPIAADTWRRATILLNRLAESPAGLALASLPAPTLAPCADGSVDLFWQTPTFKTLINVQGPDRDSDFYAETNDGLTLKGTFRSDVHKLTVLEAIFVRGLG